MTILAACLLLAADNEAVKQIEELEHGIAQAVVSRDAAFIDRVFDADFAYTGVRGEQKGKAEILAEIKAGELKFEVLKFEDLRVRLHGKTAVVTGLATTKGTSPQGEIAGQIRYTRVYVQKEGAWKLVAFQGTAEKK